MFGISKQISRRNALRWFAGGVAASAVMPAVLTGCNADSDASNSSGQVVVPDDFGTYPYELPDLPYDYDEVDALVDAETMEIHHSRHHQAYVNNLNSALEEAPDLQDTDLVDLLSDLESVPEEIREDVRNNGGGHANHSMFWEMLSPEGGGEPTGEIAQAIDEGFGSFDQFQSEFEGAAGGVFGSGWAWLVSDDNGSVSILQTANQDSPLMEGARPLLGIDVWEHAYYLRYRNERGEYVGNLWDVVDWEAVNQRFTL